MLNQKKLKNSQKEFTNKKRSRKENQENQVLKIRQNPHKQITEKKKVNRKNKRKNFSDTNSSNSGNFKFKKEIYYHEIQECKSVIASDNDFSKVLNFIKSLWNKEEESTGIIKVTSPTNWRKVNDFIFDNYYFPKFKSSDKKLETRIQNLASLCEGKKFKFVKNFNFREYYQEALKLNSKIFPQELPLNKVEQIESEYWKIVLKKNPNLLETETNYAADHSYSSFLTNPDFIKISEILENNNTWNLSTLHNEPDSLFQFLKINRNDHISGLTTPWVYFGMLFSTFCWHVEDLYMYSLNYMFYGSPKIWYSVSHTQKEALDKYIKNKKLNISIEDPYILHRLILLVDPLELIDNGIKVYRGVQYPGDFIITLPKAYHAGFSTGFNIAEAVNIATNEWADFGIQASNDYQLESSKVPVFPMEWIYHQNLKFCNLSKFSNLSEQNKIETIYSKLIHNEKNKRNHVENILRTRKIQFHNFTISEKENYMKSQCCVCSNYNYFSFLKCGLCTKKSCLNHFADGYLKICTCSKPLVLLYYRSLEFKTLN